MSGSETGIISSRETFNVALQKSPPPPSQSVIHNVRLPYSAEGTPVYKPPAIESTSSFPPVSAAAGGNGVVTGATATSTITSPSLTMNMNASGEPGKRKRGRPRKYGPDGAMTLALSPSAQAQQSPSQSQSVTITQCMPVSSFSPSQQLQTQFSSVGSPTSTNMKKSRGRPPGSSKKQQMEALGSAGFGFTPHVITVKAGEDVSSKIMSFSQHGPRAVCILSANGAISNVTLRQPSSSGGTVSYEGRFEILSLSGSYLLTESGGQRSRTGGLSVSLAGPDGRVLGGCVAGLLTAAAPVQVIVGSFVADGRKDVKPLTEVDPLSAAPKLTLVGGATGASSPPSRGTLSESSGGPGSPLNQSTGACNNTNPQGIGSISWK
ncbi:PPC domain [Dillenia turbinata]|uniref:AT-hook motif nuclear-localized protein n=1 Tax=Dillenia turbinata TaxID=194707 RepID=A0AAN8ZFN1_9MAGN